MKTDSKTILLDGALYRLREFSDANRLMLHCEHSLLAVSWADLRQTRDGVTVVLGPRGLGNVVATKVAVDNAWIVDPKSQRLLLAREGGIEFVDPSGQEKARTVTVPGLPVGTFAAALDSTAKRLLLAVMRDVNPDFAEYGLVVADLVNGRLAKESTIHTNSDLELLWEDKLGSWVICDTNKATVWRWDGNKPALKLASSALRPVHSATIAASDHGVIVSALVTQSTGATGLISGRAEQDRVIWNDAVALPGPNVLVARRHPGQALWACLAQEGRAQQIQIRDASGKVLGEAIVRPPAHLSDLVWSVAAPTSVWGFGVHALASATFNQ